MFRQTHSAEDNLTSLLHRR